MSGRGRGTGSHRDAEPRVGNERYRFVCEGWEASEGQVVEKKKKKKKISMCIDRL